MALQLILTNAGRAALVAAEEGGTAAIRIVEVGLTASVVVVAPTLTALPGEFKRVDGIPGTAADAYTVHLVVRDSSDDAYTARALGLYLEDGTLFAVYGQADPFFQKVEASHFYAAVDWRFEDPEAIHVEFGDTNFLNPPATEEIKGVAYLATIAEALAGAVADKIITPATLKLVLDNYVAAEELGIPNGVATLGADGKLLVSQRPPIDLIDVFPAADEAAMLALVATVGDFAVRVDNGLVYVLQALPATVLGNWLEISTPAPVSSVNGKVGAVVLNAADVGAVPTTRTVTGAGLLAGQGGALNANQVLTLAIASAAEALAGLVADKALTPASLSSILAAIAAKASGAATVSGGGLVTGGGVLSGNPTLSVAAASAAELLAASISNKAVTPASFGGLAKSLTPNGYVQLPGGFMIQWIRYRVLTTTEQLFWVTYPITFPNACFVVSATGYSAAPSLVRDLWPQVVAEPDVVGCYIQTQSEDVTDNRLDGFDLIIFGY